MIVEGWEGGKGSDWDSGSIGVNPVPIDFLKPSWPSSFVAKCIQCNTTLGVKFESKSGTLFMTPKHRCPGEWWLEVEEQ